MPRQFYPAIQRAYHQAEQIADLLEIPPLAPSALAEQLEAVAPAFAALSEAAFDPGIVLTPTLRWLDWIAAYRAARIPFNINYTLLGYRRRLPEDHPPGSWTVGVLGSPAYTSASIAPLRELPHLRDVSRQQVMRRLAPPLGAILSACLTDAQPGTVVRDTALGGLHYQAGREPGSYSDVRLENGHRLTHTVEPGFYIKLAPLLVPFPFNPTVMATDLI